MSDSKPPLHIPRPSTSADASLRAEMQRISEMTVAERVKAALTMRNRFDWLQPMEGNVAGSKK